MNEEKPYTILNAAADLIKGKLKFVSADVRQERLDICSTCEARDSTLNLCTACGCYLPTKTKLKESKCPMGLW